MGFLETGFGLFAVIIVWNIFLVGFGGTSDTQIITSESYPGYSSNGQVNVEGTFVASTSQGYIAPTGNPDASSGYADIAQDATGNVFDLLGKVFFGSADALQKSGIGYPLSWVLGLILNVFVTAYIAVLAWSVFSAIRGGGVGNI